MRLITPKTLCFATTATHHIVNTFISINFTSRFIFQLVHRLLRIANQWCCSICWRQNSASKIPALSLLLPLPLQPEGSRRTDDRGACWRRRRREAAARNIIVPTAFFHRISSVTWSLQRYITHPDIK